MVRWLGLWVLVVGCSGPIRAQTATAPVFDVATVKPAAPQTPGNNSSGVSTSKGLLDARNVTLKRLIMGAYSVGPHQVVGAPDWVASERFDVLAKTLEPIDDDAVMMGMLQRLMAERFKLKVHRETRTMSAYLLEVGKGSLLEKAPGGESSTNTSSDDTGTTLTARNTDMKLFAQVLAREMDLPVVNETELPGPYNFRLHWTRDNAAGAKPGEEVSIFTAIQEQLGLKLHVGRGPVDVVVVDAVELPSAN
jgi:uncharacterized protein (TIGR03435 family)